MRAIRRTAIYTAFLLGAVSAQLGAAFPVAPPATPDAASRQEQNAARAAAEAPASKNDAKDAAKDLAAKDTKKRAADDKEAPKTSYIVRGRVRPASLDEVFAIIQSSVVNDDAELAAEAKETDAQAVAKVRAYLHDAGFTERHSGADAKPEGGRIDGTREVGDEIRQVETAERRGARGRREVGRESQAAVNLLTYVCNNKRLLARFESHASRYRRLSKDTLERLILTLNNHIENVVVRVKQGDKVVATALTDKDGEYEVTLKENGDGEVYVFSTEFDNHLTQREVVINDNSFACLPAKKGGNRVELSGETEMDCHDFRVNLLIEDRPVSLLARAVVGYQQAGAAAAEIEQNYFFDLFISKSLPIPQKINPDFGERARIWGAIRVISAPQSGAVTVGDLGRSFVTNVAGLEVNQAARVFDYLHGVELRLPWFGNNAQLPSFDRDTKQKFSLSFIAGAGFITPTNPAQAAKTFEISDDLRARYAAKYADNPQANPLVGKKYISFAPNDRDRFFRQYYAGLRMQTFYFNRRNVPLQRFPAQFDLQFGVNEYVTGGRARGGVVRLDGYFPLPYEGARFINLFGTAIFKPVRAKIETPLILKPAGAAAQPHDPQSALAPVSQFNRDYYRVGVGIDFISFLGKLLGNN